uniref:Uncharacterized protein n=1 Tax=Kalanchoe fedtschenkoi TaxID=63787 RepID=A0A7N0RG35_KALFE
MTSILTEFATIYTSFVRDTDPPVSPLCFRYHFLKQDVFKKATPPTSRPQTRSVFSKSRSSKRQSAPKGAAAGVESKDLLSVMGPHQVCLYQVS